MRFLVNNRRLAEDDSVDVVHCARGVAVNAMENRSKIIH